MRLRYLIIAGYHKQELEVEHHLALIEHINRIVERFGPVDLVARL